MTQKKTYFASDFHLGTPTLEKSHYREKLIVKWLHEIREDAEAIYLIGDIFDFWFEYSKVVPKGFVRLLGTLATLKDEGVPIYVFTGNHDIWMFDYFEKELGIPVYRECQKLVIQGKKFYVGHGDGIGPGDNGFKFIKKIFTNRFCQFCFNWLHPNIGIGLADFWSKKSRIAGGEIDEFLGEDKEFQILHAKSVLKEEHFDYFVFGHRHFPYIFDLPGDSKYINTGDWLDNFTYAEFDGNEMQIKKFKH